MATMNIAGTTPVDDPSYRYKMPRIVAKVEGRGNGIKTVLVNVVDLGQSLNREAPEITKFFGCELGSQTTYSADRAIVNGAHTAQSLQEHLCKYIENFVLCAQCKLPETHYKIKSGLIAQKCLACGHKETVDMTHKLTTFILAQHKKAKEAGGKSDKKEKKDKKDKKEDREEGETTPGGAKEDGAPVKEKKDKKDKKEKKDKDKGDRSAAGTPALEEPLDGEADLKNGDDLSAEDGDVETDKAAVDASIVRFNSWFAVNSSKGRDLVLEELRMVQTFASLHVRYRPLIFVGAVFTEALLSAKEITQHREFVAALAGKLPATQRHLIAAFEWFCGVRHPHLARMFPVVLKLLYEEELVEEDVFLSWSSDLTRNEFSADDSLIPLDTLEELRAGAEPFIRWLEEAEEEDDDEEGDEEEEEEEDD